MLKSLKIKGGGIAIYEKPISELPYGITQFYLPLDTDKRAPP